MTSQPYRPWFRFYNEVLGDQKLDRIARDTGTPYVAVVGVWAGLLCLASASPVRGVLMLTPDEPLAAAEIARVLRLTPRRLARLIAAFEKYGMAGWRGSALAIVRWADRQYESDHSTARVQQHRVKRACNVSDTPVAPAPETASETETETETDIRDGALAPAFSPANPPNPFPEVIDGASPAHAPPDVPGHAPPSANPSNSFPKSVDSARPHRRPASAAVEYLRTRSGARLRAAQTEAVDAVVRSPDDLRRWKEVVDAWLLSGSRNPGNVAGLLDWFAGGIPGYARSGARHNSQREVTRGAYRDSSRGDRGANDLTPEEQQSKRAELGAAGFRRVAFMGDPPPE